MLEAIPTLLRRLAESWRRAFEPSLEPTEKWGPPLPEFVQKSLFAKLLVPEVNVVVPKPDGRSQRDQDDRSEAAVDEHGMVLAEWRFANSPLVGSRSASISKATSAIGSIRAKNPHSQSIPSREEKSASPLGASPIRMQAIRRRWTSIAR